MMATVAAFSSPPTPGPLKVAPAGTVARLRTRDRPYLSRFAANPACGTSESRIETVRPDRPCRRAFSSASTTAPSIRRRSRRSGRPGGIPQGDPTCSDARFATGSLSPCSRRGGRRRRPRAAACNRCLGARSSRRRSTSRSRPRNARGQSEHSTPRRKIGAHAPGGSRGHAKHCSECARPR